MSVSSFLSMFFYDTATTELYTLSLHDALPIFHSGHRAVQYCCTPILPPGCGPSASAACITSIRCSTVPVVRWCRFAGRSEEHTSELQSRENLVCRLLLEKKKIKLAYLVSKRLQ